MKPSKAMLRGFKMAGGRQCTGVHYEGHQLRPNSVCAIGAWSLAVHGNAAFSEYNQSANEKLSEANAAFLLLCDSSITEANDEGMSIPDIAGILASEGY